LARFGSKTGILINALTNGTQVSLEITNTFTASAAPVGSTLSISHPASYSIPGINNGS